MCSKQSKVPIAVDVALGDRPVVRAGVPRGSGEREHDAALELGRVDVERDAPHAVDAELNRGNAAVQRRPIVLYAGRHLDRLTFDVHGDLKQVFRLGRAAGPALQRAAKRHGERRGAGDASARWRFAARRQRDVLELIVPREERQQ